MADPRDPFDRELGERLARYEAGAPTGEPPAVGGAARRAWWPAVVGAGVVAGAAIALVLLQRPTDPFGQSSPSPSVSAPASGPVGTGSPAPSPPDVSPDPSAEPSESALSWSVTLSGTEGTLERATDVVATEGGFVAVGTHYEAAMLPVIGNLPQHEGRVWRSADGRSWQTITDDVFADATLDHVVVAANGTLLVFGTIGDFSVGDTTPATWLSRDGADWERIDGPLPDLSVAHLERGARGYLAQAVPLVIGGAAQLWFSPDGLTWDLVRTADPSEMWLDLAAGDEGFVVVGVRGEGDAAEPMAIASADGREWIEAGSPPAGVRSVAADGPDWISIGPWAQDPGAGSVPIWASANGLDWAESGAGLPVRPFPLDGETACREFPLDIHATGDLFVAATTLTYPCSEGGVVTYGTQLLSRDAVAWEPLPFPPAADLVAEPTERGSVVLAAAGDAGHLVLVGQSGGSAAFWLGESP